MNTRIINAIQPRPSSVNLIAWWPFLLILATCSESGSAQTERNATIDPLPRNGGFEDAARADADLPDGWHLDRRRTEGKGLIVLDRERVATGKVALRLEPSRRNDTQFPLSLAQELPTEGLRGREIEFSGMIAATGAARGLIGLQRAGPGGNELLMLVQPDSGGKWVRQAKSYRVPDDPEVKLYLSVWVSGTSGTAWFDDIAVRVVDTKPSAAPATPLARSAEPAATTTVRVDAGTTLRQIPKTLFGANIEWRWNANSLWQEQQRRVDPVASHLTKALGVGLIRYPGGIYSDFYHWRDGIGPYERRPIVKHEAGKPDESRPNFGTEEVLAFATSIGAEPLFTVNAGTGTAAEAAAWVAHVNADRLRVRYWEIGNELYINTGTPVSKAVTVEPKVYARRVVEFATAMKRADPRIVIGAIGGLNQGRYQQMSYPDWNEIVLRDAGEHIDFLSVHNAYAPILTGDEKGKDPRAVYRAMLARPTHITKNLKATAAQLERRFPDPARRPFIAVTEWGPIFQFFNAGEYVDHPKTLASAVFVASTLKAFIESPETEIGAFWMLNDFGVLGWISSANDDFPPAPEWIPTARYYALQLFANHFGKRVVPVVASGPTFDADPVGWSDRARDVPLLDVTASLSEDGRTLFLMVINRSLDDTLRAEFDLAAFNPAAEGTAWQLSGTGVDANTGSKVIRVPNMKWGKQVVDPMDRRFERGGPAEVTLSSSMLTGLGPRFSHEFPRLSVTSLELRAAPEN